MTKNLKWSYEFMEVNTKATIFNTFFAKSILIHSKKLDIAMICKK